MFAGPLGRSTFTPPKSSFDSPLYGLVSLRRSHFGLEDAAEKGCIQVHVHRVQQHQLPGMAGRPPVEPVTSFTVVDNGVGFTDPNLKSFETADSTAKIERGGKGIGRLTWLVVFEKAEIESRFRGYEDRLRRRSFSLLSDRNRDLGFLGRALESEETIETRVRLVYESATRSRSGRD